MDFSESDFSKLKYRVDLITDYSGKLTEQFPELKKYPVFNLELIGINPLKIFSYIVLLCDINSPLLAIDNISKRKTQAAILSKFNRNTTGSVEQLYVDVTNGLNSYVNSQFIQYCKFMNNKAFSNMIMYEIKLHHQQEAFLNNQDHDELFKINKNIQAFTEYYEESKKIFLRGDIDTEGLNEELRLGVEQEEIPTPESIAKDIMAGKDPTEQWNPYGKHYMPVLTMANARIIYKEDDVVPKFKK